MPNLSQAASITRLIGLLRISQAPTARLEQYIARIVNNAGVVFDEIVIFYKVRGQQGVVFLNKIGVIPGEVVDFELGVCFAMESYVIGLFIGSDLVGQLPAPGDGVLTPERVSQIHPGDVDPCADVWEIV